jgi:GntR family transcriptional regulator, transcriptional repressor for pyruvate dehydrogenase complex
MGVAKIRLYQEVAQGILLRIRSGEFPPGTRLPGERELADELGISRVTVREAEIALEAQGFITIKTGSGAYVRRDVVRSDGALPDISAFDLTTARSVIEAEAAALAAVHASEAQLLALREIVDGMAGAEHESAESLDQRFHLTIAQATGNPAIEHLVCQLWRMRGEVPRVREVYASVCTADGAARTNEHRAIFDALQARDPAGARAAMRDHFHRLFESMMSAREDAAIAELRRSLGEDRQRFLQSMQI